MEKGFYTNLFIPLTFPPVTAETTLLHFSSHSSIRASLSHSIHSFLHFHPSACSVTASFVPFLNALALALAR